MSIFSFHSIVFLFLIYSVTAFCNSYQNFETAVAALGNQECQVRLLNGFQKVTAQFDVPISDAPLLERLLGKWSDSALPLDAEIVLIGGYGTGAYVTRELKKMGYWNLTHVHPEGDAPSFVKFDASPFQRVLGFRWSDDPAVSHQQTLSRFVQENFANRPAAVAVLHEGAVEVGEQLQQALGFAGNEMSLLDARRHKEAQQKALGYSIPTWHIGSENEVRELLISGAIQYPLVLKLDGSSGMDGLHIVFNEEQMHLAIEEELVLRNVDKYEHKIDSMILQPYISGEEYAVNMESVDGWHVLAQIWKYEKVLYRLPNGSGFVPNYVGNELVPFTSEKAELLSAFVRKQITDLGVRNGSTHTEVLFSKNEAGKAVMNLVESGARPMGGGFPLLGRYSTGVSEVDLLVMRLIDKKTFTRYAVAQSLGVVPRDAFTVNAIALNIHQEGVVKQVHEELLQQLPTYFGVNVMKKPGDLLQNTQNVVTIPAYVFLRGSRDDVHRDLELIKESIQYHFFELE